MHEQTCENFVCWYVIRVEVNRIIIKKKKQTVIIKLNTNNDKNVKPLKRTIIII